MSKRIANGERRRTLERLSVIQTDECMPWPHSLYRKTGYGAYTSPSTAHAAMLELVVGPRPSRRHDACHSCRLRACVNPRHLYWGTRARNLFDRHRDGTYTLAKLEPEQVYEVRRLADGRLLPQAVIAERFDISLDMVYRIKKRLNWTHLPER